MSTNANVTSPAEESLVYSAYSRGLILVLCGYLVGITASHVCSPAMEACALAAAAIGLIAHALFVSQARKRQTDAARLAIQRASVRLERRVEMHVSIPSRRFWRRLHDAAPHPHEQYITVVRAPRSATSRQACPARS